MSKKSKDPVVATVSGALAGMCETIVVWPMELSKTRLQLDRGKFGQGKYKGMFDVMKQSVEKGGIRALYVGIWPVLLGSGPKAAIRFGLFQTVQNKLRSEDGSSSATKNLAAGMIAGASEAVIIVAPIETVKTKLIDGNRTFLEGFKTILKDEGPQGLYKGILPTVFKQASNQGIRFATFNLYSDFMSKDDLKRTLSTIEALVGGMISGCTSTLLNNPVDVLKTRQQGLGATDGFVATFVKLVREEGVLKLWAGTLPRLARVVPGQATIFATYSKLSEFVAWGLGREPK